MSGPKREVIRTRLIPAPSGDAPNTWFGYTTGINAKALEEVAVPTKRVFPKAYRAASRSEAGVEFDVRPADYATAPLTKPHVIQRHIHQKESGLSHASLPNYGYFLLESSGEGSGCQLKRLAEVSEFTQVQKSIVIDSDVVEEAIKRDNKGRRGQRRKNGLGEGLADGNEGWAGEGGLNDDSEEGWDDEESAAVRNQGVDLAIDSDSDGEAQGQLNDQDDEAVGEADKEELPTKRSRGETDQATPKPPAPAKQVAPAPAPSAPSATPAASATPAPADPFVAQAATRLVAAHRGKTVAMKALAAEALKVHPEFTEAQSRGKDAHKAWVADKHKLLLASLKEMGCVINTEAKTVGFPQ